MVVVGVFIADDSSADPVDGYSFSYNGTTVTQTACNVDNENSLVWISYSIDDGSTIKSYSVGYTLNDTAKTATVGVDTINRNTVKCVNGDYSNLIIPPVIKYNSNVYTINKIGPNIFGTSLNNTDEPLIQDSVVESFVLAAEPTTEIKANSKAFNMCTELTDIIVYGRFTGKYGTPAEAMVYMCQKVTNLTFGEVTTVSFSNGLVFYGADPNHPETDSLTVTVKTINEGSQAAQRSAIPKLTNKTYQDFTVILRLAAGSVKLNSLTVTNLNQVQFYEGDTSTFGETPNAKGLTIKNSISGSPTPSVTTHNICNYAFFFKSGNEPIGIVEFNEGNMGSKSMLDVPVKDHYSNEWDANALSLENKVVHQVPVMYTFTFTGADAAVDPISFTVENIGSKVMPAVPAREHYDAAWDVAVFSLANQTVTALYTPITYTFTFTGADAAVDPISFTVENIGSKVMPAVPARDGYEVKWDTTSFALENKTVYAIFTKLVSVDENGSAEVVLSEEVSSFKPASGTKTVSVEMSANISVKVVDAKDLAEKVVVSKVETVINDTNVTGTAYEFTFTADGTAYNGKIQVTLPYTKENGKEPAVYYWNGSESVKMRVVSSTDASVTFETDHNSLYIVASETPSKEDGVSFLLYFGIMAAIGLCVAALVGFTFYRGKA